MSTLHARGRELLEQLKLDAQAVADNAPGDDTAAWVATATELIDHMLCWRIEQIESREAAVDYEMQSYAARDEAVAKAELARLLLGQAQGLVGAWRGLRRNVARLLRAKARDVGADQ